MSLSRLNRRIAHWLQSRFGKGLPEHDPPARGQTIHVIIIDGTMSTMEEGCETNAGLTAKLLQADPPRLWLSRVAVSPR